MNLEEFGKNLRRLRERAGLTQQALAELVPVTVQLLSRWENGRKKPGRQSLIRLVEIFANHLSPGEAWEWAWQVGQELNREALQSIFPHEDVQPPQLPRPKPVQHPPLPNTYLNRPTLEARILEALPPEGSSKSLVLFGPGGSGKSTLAAWAAEALHRHYPDGIIWVEYDSVMNIQHRIADSFQVRLNRMSLADRAGDLRSLLRGKRCLLILEDVWDHPDLAHLKVYNDQCPLLITSRDKTIAYIFDAPSSIEVGGLTPTEGQTLLQDLSGCDLTAAELEQFVNCVEGSPLALTLIGAQLSNGYSAAELLAALGSDQANLDILDIGPPRTRTRSLGRCFDLSYHNLPEARLRKYFAQLSCFVGPFAPNFAAAIWGITLKEARYVLDQLNRFMMVTQEARGYRLHVLLRDYARQRLTADWPDLTQTTHARYAAYYIRHYLYHPQVVEGVTDSAPILELSWTDIIAGLKWAMTHMPQLAVQAALLAHTERGALLEAVGADWIEAIETYLPEISDQVEQAILGEILGDLHLLNGSAAAGLTWFERASLLWEKLEDGLAASQAKLRMAGAYLLQQEFAAAAEAARQAQALLRRSLPLAPGDKARADRLFYWFNMVYNPLVRWEDLSEADVASLVDLADQTHQNVLKARALSIYQLWCTTKAVPRSAEIRQRGRELACQAYWLWKSCGRADRADDEVSFTQYRTKNHYSHWFATRYARRRSQTTPRVNPSQIDLFKGRNQALYWWLGATEKQRIAWLSWMLPRYLGADNPLRLPHLPPDSRASRWVEEILNIGMLGGASRRVMMEKQPPRGHILNGPEWRVLSGQRAFPLAGNEVRRLVQHYLATLEQMLA